MFYSNQKSMMKGFRMKKILLVLLFVPFAGAVDSDDEASDSQEVVQAPSPLTPRRVHRNYIKRLEGHRAELVAIYKHNNESDSGTTEKAIELAKDMRGIDKEIFDKQIELIGLEKLAAKGATSLETLFDIECRMRELKLSFSDTKEEDPRALSAIGTRFSNLKKSLIILQLRQQEKGIDSLQKLVDEKLEALNEKR